ncbi:LOW QUALITY PROTEIN: uncharacterized protein C2orf15 homolog [Otolemur garnettii]|uniref:LOW QUALITY PROTEIN: uncharacterized protein C2orf15 homolog n=1 Tax=Otolemur garnettii TaxID=30611 RepID=UPI000274153D|nr:LOW QUALITY PROTEIN: uncharacterized protein C2orf15 homolog [Otolemur garnettii]
MKLVEISAVFTCYLYFFFSNQVEEGFPLLKKTFAKYLDIRSAIPMGYSLSKSATQVSNMPTDSKGNNHVIQRSEKSELEPVTQLFQNTKKVRLEDINQENFIRIKGTGTDSLSEKAVGSMVYVMESDGIQVTDVE